MVIEIKHDSKKYKANLSKPLDISIPLVANKDNPTAWYVESPKIEPVRTEQFTGSVAEGGSVNFRNIFFNPHGHGTHTECVGHITKEVYSINKTLTNFFFFAELITVKPEKQPNGDEIITWEQIKNKLKAQNCEAIIIRTFPNTQKKLHRQYSSTNPPFIEAIAMSEITARGIKHFLIDLPSVDKELDNGNLAAHHSFWEHPKNTNLERTITELIYVPNSIKDNIYLLNLQIAPFENDASPSKPVLYSLTKE